MDSTLLIAVSICLILILVSNQFGECINLGVTALAAFLLGLAVTQDESYGGRVYLGGGGDDNPGGMFGFGRAMNWTSGMTDKITAQASQAKKQAAQMAAETKKQADIAAAKAKEQAAVIQRQAEEKKAEMEAQLAAKKAEIIIDNLIN